MVWIVFLLMQLADIWTTVRVLDAGGKELNPVIRYLMRKLGDGWMLVKVLLAFAAALIVQHEIGNIGVYAISALYFGVVVYNHFQLRRR